MQNRDQRPPGDRITIRGVFFVLYAIAKSYATCITVFTRHTFGSEALGWNGLGAFFLIPIYGAFAHAPEMLRFWGVWFVALVAQRIRTAWALSHGWKLHSRYSGQPWLGYLPRFVKHYRGALMIEYAVVFFSGVFLLPVSENFGLFVMVGSWSLLLVYGIEQRALVMETRRMRDAEIEMQTRVDIYQGNSDDF